MATSYEMLMRRIYGQHGEHPNPALMAGQNLAGGAADAMGLGPAPPAGTVPQPQPQSGQSGGLGALLGNVGGSNDFGARIGDFLAGMAGGGNMNESLALGGRSVAAGRQSRQASQSAMAQQAALRQAIYTNLKARGVDDATAQILALDPDAASKFVLESMKEKKGIDPLEAQYKQAQIDKIRSDISVQSNPDARKRLGLNPIYGKDENGNMVIMQPSESGGLVKADLPQGVTLEPGVQRIDLGTAWGILDRSGSITATVPKDISGEAAARAKGTAMGEAQAQAGPAKITAEQTIQKIDQLLADPNLSSASGIESWMPDPMAGVINPKTLDVRRRVEQLRGSAFLEAYNGLKGGGQITEVEGKKAEDALARLDTAQTDAGYKQALVDFRDAVAVGYQKLAARAGGAAPELNVQPQKEPLSRRIERHFDERINPTLKAAPDAAQSAPQPEQAAQRKLGIGDTTSNLDEIPEGARVKDAAGKFFRKVNGKMVSD